MNKLGYGINPDGAKYLLVEVFEQAVADLRSYRRQGWIVNNQINREKPHRDNSGKVRVSEVLEILFFFSEAGPLQFFCDFFKMEISPQQIRQQLQLF